MHCERHWSESLAHANHLPGLNRVWWHRHLRSWRSIVCSSIIARRPGNHPVSATTTAPPLRSSQCLTLKASGNSVEKVLQTQHPSKSRHHLPIVFLTSICSAMHLPITCTCTITSTSSVMDLSRRACQSMESHTSHLSPAALYSNTRKLFCRPFGTSAGFGAMIDVDLSLLVHNAQCFDEDSVMEIHVICKHIGSGGQQWREDVSGPA